MRTIRASEIGAYIFCRRAWWYALRGFPSRNQSELSAGQELHKRHGQAVMTTGCLRYAAYLLLLAALGMLTAYVVWLLI
jgi:CRISPR/Cas system-associated exonuclease Cas4 (RecB family)